MILYSLTSQFGNAMQIPRRPQINYKHPYDVSYLGALGQAEDKHGEAKYTGHGPFVTTELRPRVCDGCLDVLQTGELKRKAVTGGI